MQRFWTEKATWSVGLVALAVCVGCGDAASTPSESGGAGPSIQLESSEETAESDSEGSAEESETDESGGVQESPSLEGSEEVLAGHQIDEPRRSPLEVWREERRDVAFARNVIDVTVPHAIYVYVHEGGGTKTSFEALEPGEVERFMPAPKERPVRFVETMEELVIGRLVDVGVDRERAEEIVASKSEALFERHGHRVIYISGETESRSSPESLLGAVERTAVR